MKKLALAAVFAGAATTAFAGSYKSYAKDEVVMEPVVVVEETQEASSSAATFRVTLNCSDICI